MANQRLNTLAKGAVLTGVGMFASKIFTYFYRAIVARMVGPDAYGQLSQGLMILGIATTISLFAINQAIKKYVPEYRMDNDLSSVKGAVYSALNITLPVSIFMGVLMFISADFLAQNFFKSPAVAPVIKILAFVPPFSVFSRVSISTTVAYKQLKYRVITNQFFQNIVQLIFTIGFVVLGWGVAGAAGGWLLGVVLSSLLGFYFMEFKVGPIIRSKESVNFQRRKMIRYSYPLVLSGMIGTILGWADTAFLGYFMDDATVGFYNAALPTAALIMIPYKAFNSLALPSMSEAEKEGKGLKKMLKTLTRWTFYLAFPAFMLMFLFSEQVLHILFGSQYTVASNVLVILAVGQLYSSAVGHLDQVLQSIEKNHILFRNSIAQLALNMALNFVLIPDFGLGLGMIGAALATAGSTIFISTLLLLEVYYFEGTHPFSRDTWKPVVAAVPGLILVYLGLNLLWNTVPVWALIPGGIIFGVMFVACLVLLGGIKEDDRDIIVGIGRRMNRGEEADKIADLLIRQSK
ncbi:MAG: flippase [Nanohaloarchaea archaeon]|nr:flippase [Candidatus Nanohaloarchaea archaeon]